MRANRGAIAQQANMQAGRQEGTFAAEPSLKPHLAEEENVKTLRAEMEAIGSCHAHFLLPMLTYRYRNNGNRLAA